MSPPAHGINATPGINDRLLDTAVDQFGRFGPDSASTRAIAAAAGTAMSSITYHFGGKEGLYLAAAKHIASCVQERLEEPLGRSRATAAKDGPDAATEALLAVVDGFVALMTAPESTPWARFIVREQMAPSAAFDIIYAEIIEGLATYVTGLLLRIGGAGIDEHGARLKALTLFGQILVFRVAHATVLRLTGWKDIAPAQADEVRALVRENTLTLLAGIRGDRP